MKLTLINLPMKVLSYIFVLVLVPVLFSCTENNPVSAESANLIVKLDMEQLQSRLLPDFELVRKRGRWREGREYVFHDKKNDSMNVFIRIGIHSSAEEAEEIAYELMNWSSILPQEDSLQVLGIGDKLWLMPNSVGYIFIRNNIFIITYSHKLAYEKLLGLTKAIDLDIKNKAGYITFAETIELPEIQSIAISKQVLKDGDTATITVNAIDPDNETLEYISSGLGRQNNDPQNIFLIKASRDYVPEPFIGSHRYEFIVINESNVVSRKTGIEVRIE